MALNFPDSPVNGSTFTSGSTTWTYYTASSSWRTTAVVGAGASLPSTISIQNTTGNAYSPGSNSFAIGVSANAAGGNSIAMGLSANAVAVDSIALGRNTVAFASTITIGANTRSTDVDSVAIGRDALVNGNAIAIGSNAQATALYSVAIGSGAASGTANTIVLGTTTHTTVIPGGITLSQSSEVLNTKTGTTGVVVHDFSTGSIFYHSGVVANFTANFTNVPATDSRTNVVTLVIAQGVSGYIPNAVQIAGVAQTIKWLGGNAPTPGANKTEIVSFTLIRTGALWVVTGSLSSYG